MSLGRHLLVELTGCPAERLNDVAGLEQVCVRAARNAGAAVVSSSFHPFAPHGVSGVVVIHESHIAIHTWPEHGFLALDVFTCGETIDPAAIAGAIESAIGATGARPRLLERGEAFSYGQPASDSGYSGASHRSIWFTDREADIALSLRATGALFRRNSPHQKVEVLETVGYGRMLVLDDRIVCTERDEFIYHEMLVHVPCFVGKPPSRALVLGGGDGGAARELLRHAGIERIDIVEVDETVIEAARAHFPAMAGALDDERVHLRLDDGAEVLTEVPPGSIDILLVDSGTPSGPSDTLFSSAFYAAVDRALSDDGRFVTQVTPPSLSGDAFSASCARIGSALGTPHPYLAYIPTYNTGMLAFALATRSATRPPIADAAIAHFAAVHPLRYFNAEIAHSAFALPTYIRQLL